MEGFGGMAMLPTKRNRLIQLPVDAAIYALCIVVERCFTKLETPGALQPATTKPPTATSDSPTSSQSGCGCGNMSAPPKCGERGFVLLGAQARVSCATAAAQGFGRGGRG